LLNFTVMALLAVPLSLGALWRCGHVTGGLVTDWSFWQRPKLLSQLPMWKVVPFLIFSPWLNILRIVWWMPSILRLTVREWGLLFWWIPSTISLITTILVIDFDVPKIRSAFVRSTLVRISKVIPSMARPTIMATANKKLLTWGWNPSVRGGTVIDVSWNCR